MGPTKEEAVGVSDRRDRSYQGKIPFRLRIGITGHRRLDDEEELAAQVRRALERIRELIPPSPYTPVLFTAVSPLAEGADRLVALEILKEEGAELEAPLPLPRDEYLRDFESDASRREFDELLGRAKAVSVMASSGSRAEAYEGAERYVVDGCDLLIAIWDGKPARGRGGTAEIVAYARERQVPLFWIVADGQHQMVEELGTGIKQEVFRELDNYNRAAIAQERFEKEIAQQEGYLLAAGGASHVKGLPVEAFSGWVLPWFVKADVLARRYQSWYHAFSSALFIFAAAAVAVVASQALFAPETPEVVWTEVGLMLGLLAIVAVGRRWRVHERSISYRFLAERLRSAFFLALLGLGGRRGSGFAGVHPGHPPEESLRRTFAEVWNRRPAAAVGESDVDGLRRFLAEGWIQAQIDYHRKLSQKDHGRHQQLTWASVALFGATFLAAVLHALSLGGHESAGSLSWANTWVFLAIALPALGGALSGIRSQREYLRNSERSRHMVYYLQRLKLRMEAAPDLATVRAVAADAEDVMLDENRDWFVVMSFHDLDLHV